MAHQSHAFSHRVPIPGATSMFVAMLLISKECLAIGPPRSTDKPCGEPAAVLPASPSTGDPGTSQLDLDSYGYLLAHYAPAGKVDYENLKKHDSKRLDRLYRSLAQQEPKMLSSPDARLAFWINAYNVIVLHSVTKAYPVEEISVSKGTFFKELHLVAGRPLSLDDIEQGQIREKFHDARVHFGVNCGAASCPLLGSKPYTAENLQAKLDGNARLFINNRANLRFDTTRNELQVSEIFKWYAGDFVRDAGSIEGFLARYLEPDALQLLRSRKWTLAYLPYDWRINAANLR